MRRKQRRDLELVGGIEAECAFGHALAQEPVGADDLARPPQRRAGLAVEHEKMVAQGSKRSASRRSSAVIGFACADISS